MAIAWNNTPPPKIERRILVLKPGERVLATLLDDHVGVDIHWVSNRSRPCEGRGKCTHCTQGLQRHWRAYVPCTVQRFRQTGRIGNDPIGVWIAKIEESALELTEAHTEFLEGGGLRGMMVEICKPSGDPRQSLRIIQQGVDQDPRPPFDVRPILCRAWKVPFDHEGPRLAQAE